MLGQTARRTSPARTADGKSWQTLYNKVLRFNAYFKEDVDESKIEKVTRAASRASNLAAHRLNVGAAITATHTLIHTSAYSHIPSLSQTHITPTH